MGCKNTVLLQKLFISQKKVNITNSPWGAHTHSLFRRLSILKIEDIYKFQVACFMYKVYKGLMSPYLSTMFCLNETIHQHGTRHANDAYFV